MAVYDKDGVVVDVGYDATVISVNHRGYSTVAPENTLPAYILSKKMGFNYAETDISFTSDGVPVLLHDSTIDRTSNGSGNIGSLTFEQVRQYDFGSWMSQEYAGTKIPSFEEFLQLCKSIMLHPYIELKSNGAYTQAQINQIVDMVASHGMRGKVTYISFNSTFIGYVKNRDPSARLGLLSNAYASGDETTCENLKTGTNSVFYDTYYNALTQAVCDTFRANNTPIEVWTVNSPIVMRSLNPYVSGITSDYLIGGKVLYDSAMNNA